MFRLIDCYIVNVSESSTQRDVCVVIVQCSRSRPCRVCVGGVFFMRVSLVCRASSLYYSCQRVIEATHQRTCIGRLIFMNPHRRLYVSTFLYKSDRFVGIL